VRLDLPVAAPVLPVCHDDAGWCAVSGTLKHQPISADVLSSPHASDPDGRIWQMRPADSLAGRVSQAPARVG
jgi:hypothetical protein